MNRRQKYPAIFFCLFFWSLIQGHPVLASPALPKDTNVLLITIDTLRYDRIGILSQKYVKTPNMDDLARRSVIFTRAYAHDVLTRPSHTNIMTGTTALYHGVNDNPGFKLDSGYLTLAEYLKERKFRTAAFIGAFILDSRFGLDRGFDLYNDDNGVQEPGRFGFVERTADRVIQPAMEWIAVQKEKWFCWIHLFDPHDPYTPPEPFKKEYLKDPYSGEVAFVDSQLGVLFDFLKKSGWLEKTIVVLTSDHGEAFGEREELNHGFFAYNNTLHIPLILYYPGAEFRTVQENACHVDIFPTICDLLNLPVPSHLQGESLLPLLAGKERQKKLIYFESMSPHLSMDAAPLAGFIQGNLKFIDLPIKEVYDLSADDQEENNIASTADLPQLVLAFEKLKKSLRGKGTTQDLKGTDQDIAPLLKSLGYISGTPTKKKSYGIEDDPKTLYPLIAQVRLAIEEFQSGQTETAIKKLNTAVRIRPTYISAFSDLANAYFNLGKIDQAVATLKNGLTKNPENIHLTARLGIMLVLGKKYEEAIDPLITSTKKFKYNPDNFNYLGLAYLGSGNLGSAEKNFKKALELDPDLVPAFNNLGYLYLTFYTKTSDPKYLDSSIQNFDKALARNPNLQSARKGKEAAVNYKNRLNSTG
jgi:arylsulfatase A-like enzyme/Tfp pilus assembly protein PilF